jgi:hypothetical protein
MRERVRGCAEGERVSMTTVNSPGIPSPVYGISTKVDASNVPTQELSND